MRRLILTLLLVLALRGVATADGWYFGGAVSSCPTEIQFQFTTATVGSLIDYDYAYFATDFTIDPASPTCKIEAGLLKTGSPTGSLTGYIYSNNDTPSTHPYQVIATSTNTVDIATLTGSVAYYSFTFDTTNLTSGTKYWFALHGTAELSHTAYVRWYYGSSTGRYVKVSADGATWATNVSNYQGDIKVWK